MRISGPLADFAMFTGAMINATYAAERMFNVTDLPGDIQNAPDAKAITIVKGEVDSGM